MLLKKGKGKGNKKREEGKGRGDCYLLDYLA
jgi:hypothetical protein